VIDFGARPVASPISVCFVLDGLWGFSPWSVLLRFSAEPCFVQFGPVVATYEASSKSSYVFVLAVLTNELGTVRAFDRLLQGEAPSHMTLGHLPEGGGRVDPRHSTLVRWHLAPSAPVPSPEHGGSPMWDRRAAAVSVDMSMRCRFWSEHDLLADAARGPVSAEVFFDDDRRFVICGGRALEIYRGLQRVIHLYFRTSIVLVRVLSSCCCIFSGSSGLWIRFDSSVVSLMLRKYFRDELGHGHSWACWAVSSDVGDDCAAHITAQSHSIDSDGDPALAASPSMSSCLAGLCAYGCVSPSADADDAPPLEDLDVDCLRMVIFVTEVHFRVMVGGVVSDDQARAIYALWRRRVSHGRRFVAKGVESISVVLEGVPAEGIRSWWPSGVLSACLAGVGCSGPDAPAWQLAVEDAVERERLDAELEAVPVVHVDHQLVFFVRAEDVWLARGPCVRSPAEARLVHARWRSCVEIPRRWGRGTSVSVDVEGQSIPHFELSARV